MLAGHMNWLALKSAGWLCSVLARKSAGWLCSVLALKSAGFSLADVQSDALLPSRVGLHITTFFTDQQF